MNRCMSAALTCTLLLLGDYASASAQCGVAPGPLRIDFLERRTDPEWFTGTWDATGAIAGTGTTQVKIRLDGPVEPGRSLPATGQLDHLLTTSGGTIHLRTNARLVWSLENYPDHTVEGPFTIVSATGTYLGLDAQGTMSAIVDFTRVADSASRYHVEFKGSYLGLGSMGPAPCERSGDQRR